MALFEKSFGEIESPKFKATLKQDLLWQGLQRTSVARSTYVMDALYQARRAKKQKHQLTEMHQCEVSQLSRD